MSVVRFQLDEDCQSSSLAAALRQHGLDAVTTNELGLAGLDDEGQLKRAASVQRCIVTNNIRDFIPFTNNGWQKTGKPIAESFCFRSSAFPSAKPSGVSRI